MTDDTIRLHLIAHALDAASRMADPSSPEAQEYLRGVLTADPAAVREKLGGNSPESP